MHRVRMLLPYFETEGWHVEVLAVAPGQVAAPLDKFLEMALPSNVPVHRVRALGLGWSRIPGLGTLPLRAMGALWRRGNTLLREGNFDLVYFSTAQFPVHILGVYWKNRFGTPFLMDYQDPWVNDYYRERPKVKPPGGRLKYALASRLGRTFEPRVLRHCSGITSVSPEYPRQLFNRYDFLDPEWPVEVLPFPGDARDFDAVAKKGTMQSFFAPGDGKQHWVYVGAGGEVMIRAVSALLKAVADSVCRNDVNIHFIGTSYAPSGRGEKSFQAIAEDYGLAGQVFEYTDRIPFSQALVCLSQADALIVPGSDDPGYTASKIYPYLLAGKPLLTIFNEQSSVVSLMKETGGGVSVTFNEADTVTDIADRIMCDWIDSGDYLKCKELDEGAFEPYSAQLSAKKLCSFFNRVCSQNSGL